MNNLQATKVLDRIFNSDSKNFNNKVCVFIDGVWGIGKTYFIQNYFSGRENEYELIYTSVFGKSSVRDIEKSILIHSLPGLKNINENAGFTKIANTLINDMSNKFLGVSIENYINSFSIEDIKWGSVENKKRIICFDDIERKSDSIEMKNFLGLIERATINFDVLIIANSNELNEKDCELFYKYKEKVVDHIIKIDKTDMITLNSILISMGIEERTEIIDVYLKDNIAFGEVHPNEKSFLTSKIHNLRVFIKYVELILRLENHLEPYKVNVDILKICKAVIYDHYYPNKDEKRTSMNFDKFNIYKTINKILLNDDIIKEEFQEYFISNSEVRKDISSLYSAFKFNEEELDALIRKIKMKIQEKDLEYFIKQENVISLVSALSELIEIDKDIKKKLFQIAIELYSPERYISHTKINYLQWNDFDNYGNEIECSKNIITFIEKVNQKCAEKFQDFIDNKLEEAKSAKDYEELLKIYEFRQIYKIEDFEASFDYYFEKLIANYSSETVEKINTLIIRTDSNLISDFFTSRIKNENQITKIKKYELFDFELERKIQYEYEEEYHRNNPLEEIV